MIYKSIIGESGEILEEFMNKPVDHDWNDQDVYNEYCKYKDKRRVSRTFCISITELNIIIRGVENGKD